MLRIRTIAAVVATLGMSAVAQAGIFNLNLGGQCGAAKSYGCASTSQPSCCKPSKSCKSTITRPCDTQVNTYQRKVSNKKAPCCRPCGKPKSCCARAPKSCSKSRKSCCKPAAPKCSKPRKSCSKSRKSCCKPAAPKCSKPSKSCCDAKKSCGDPCDKANRCCNADPCEIAELIYKSQTACYAKDRAKAIDNLGDRFSCVCNPEIMVALVYGLNDADERVRAEAADEIGDQQRENDACCCSKEVVAALTTALSDCDRNVRREAEEALVLCGHCVVDGCCPTKSPCCAPAGCGRAPAKGKEAAPPAPPKAQKAFVPSRLNRTHTFRSIKTRSKLAGLFSLIDRVY